MADVGPILPYYLRSIRNIDFSSGNVLGVNYIHGLLSIITFIVLMGLALLIIRARPKSPENRFMFVLLLAEAYRVMANWYNIYPFNGSEGFLQWMSYYRVGWYFCSIMCIMMYILFRINLNNIWIKEQFLSQTLDTNLPRFTR